MAANATFAEYPQYLYSNRGGTCIVQSPTEHQAKIDEDDEVLWSGSPKGPWKKKRRQPQPIATPVPCAVEESPMEDESSADDIPPPPRRRKGL